MRQRLKALLARTNADAPPGFQDAEYLRLNPDLATWRKSPIEHWFKHGLQEGRKWSLEGADENAPLDFDEETYRKAHPEAAAMMRKLRISGRQHWHLHGRRQGFRNWSRVNGTALPSAFSEADFLRDNPEVAQSIIDCKFESAASYLTHLDKTKPAGSAKSGSFFPLPWSATSDARSALTAADLLEGGFNAKAYAAANPDVARQRGEEAAGLADHWLHHGWIENRTPYGLRPYFKRSVGPRFWRRKSAVTIFGLFEAKSGLGTAARNYRDALIATGLDVTSITVKDAGHRFATEPDVRYDRAAEVQAPDTRVNIFVLNADMMHRFFFDGRMHLLNDSYNIGIWYWELSYFRSDWANAFGALDELWVSSDFVRNALAALSPIPVRILPPKVQIDEIIDPRPRSRFRIPDEVFVFGCIFDVGSGVDRKNPHAAVDAFRLAFGSRNDVLLALKYHSARHDPTAIRRLREHTEGMQNVRFFAQEFDEVDNLSFKLALDCLVSPHRGEGFGLNIAEAMLLQKPVVATDYGGSVDFLDETTGYPVAFALKAIGRQIGPYPPDALWADPSVEHLAHTMTQVLSDREEAGRRAERGREKVRSLYSTETVGAAMSRRLDELELFQPAAAFTSSWARGTAMTPGVIRNADIAFSVIVPVYNIEADLLYRCVRSVMDQTYEGWELVLYDDGSTREETLSALRDIHGKDPRIRVCFGSENQGIAGATNNAVHFTSGTFIALLDNDDELAPNALSEMASAIRHDPEADILYSDEDKIEADGRFSDHYFKPDWSPEHLESVMYLLHMLVIRRSLLLEVGGFRSSFSGAQDYDLALRASRKARKIVHVPEVLYHWRKIEGSASATIDAKPIALERARAALEDHVKACGRSARVEEGLARGLFRVRDTVAAGTKVTLVIFTDNRAKVVPGRGKINLFDYFFDSILQKTKSQCQLRFLVVDNANLTSRQKSKIEKNQGKVISFEGSSAAFNFSKKANFALARIETEHFILLNDDMEVIRPDWVDALVELAQRPSIGVVGARLLFPDDSIQHCGIVLGINNNVAHVYHRQMANAIGYNGYTHVIRNYLAVTGACMATRLDVVDAIGPFDEALAIDYNDIDFCLRAHASGLRNVYTPFAELYHFEGMSAPRGQANPKELELFMARWGYLMVNDPFYNRNLTRLTPDFAPADPHAYW